MERPAQIDLEAIAFELGALVPRFGVVQRELGVFVLSWVLAWSGQGQAIVPVLVGDRRASWDVGVDPIRGLES